VRLISHAEAHQKSGLAAKALRRVRAAFCVAEEMGESVGRGKVLLGPLPEGAEMIAMPPVILFAKNPDEKMRPQSRVRRRLWTAVILHSQLSRAALFYGTTGCS
jgi:hypothetical protein